MKLLRIFAIFLLSLSTNNYIKSESSYEKLKNFKQKFDKDIKPKMEKVVAGAVGLGFAALWIGINKEVFKEGNSAEIVTITCLNMFIGAVVGITLFVGKMTDWRYRLF